MKSEFLLSLYIYIYIINSFRFKKKIIFLFINIFKNDKYVIRYIESIVKHRNDKKSN